MSSNEALQFAVRSLGKKAQHSSELRRKLKERGYSEIEETITKLQELGALDDPYWVERTIESFQARNFSRFAMAQKFRKKGIPPQEWEHQLAEIDNEREAALALFEKKSHGKDLSDPKVKQRIISALARKGFSWEIIKSLLEN